MSKRKVIQPGKAVGPGKPDTSGGYIEPGPTNYGKGRTQRPVRPSPKPRGR